MTGIEARFICEILYRARFWLLSITWYIRTSQMSWSLGGRYGRWRAFSFRWARYSRTHNIICTNDRGIRCYQVFVDRDDRKGVDSDILILVEWLRGRGEIAHGLNRYLSWNDSKRVPRRYEIQYAKYDWLMGNIPEHIFAHGGEEVSQTLGTDHINFFKTSIGHGHQ